MKARKIIAATREELVAAMPPKPQIPQGSWSTPPEYVEGGSPITSTDNGYAAVLWPTTATYDRRGMSQFRLYFGWKIPFQPKSSDKILLFMNNKQPANFGWLEDVR